MENPWVYPYPCNTLNIVDDLLLRSNVHVCSGGSENHVDNDNVVKNRNKTETTKKKKHHTDAPGCKSNKWGTCKARFPRQLVPQTMVEPDSGALLLKKK